MWPNVERKNGVGVKFDEQFWNYWGPTKMFYFNSELFNDKKRIKSIYCMYLPHHNIKFNQDEIAMGLHYECGDFGEHTVLFSYEEIPNIEHNRIWDFCVFDDLETDAADLINLHNYSVQKSHGEITEKHMYKNYLEDYILQDEIDRELFRGVCQNIVKAYIKNNPTVSEEEAYIRFLENICQRICGYSEPYNLIKKIKDCCREKKEDFDKTILEIIKETQIDKNKPNILRERYEHSLSMIEKMRKPNDLNSIFQNCRELFTEQVVQYVNNEQDEIDYDFEQNKFIKTGKKIIVPIPIEGRVIRDEDKKAVFESKVKEREDEKRVFDGDDDFLL